ncbi:MAG: TrmH family RNA methyltransferase, partial [bacterium]
MKCIILIAHNLRSAHNVGSLLRTADAMGVSKVYLTGYSPYPKSENDSRLPHLALKIDKNIAKTALGAEENIDWEHNDSLDAIMD